MWRRAIHANWAAVNSPYPTTSSFAGRVQGAVEERGLGVLRLHPVHRSPSSRRPRRRRPKRRRRPSWPRPRRRPKHRPKHRPRRRRRPRPRRVPRLPLSPSTASPAPAAQVADPPPPSVGGAGAAAVAAAETQAGVPYVWGGASRAGVDCSALTMLSWEAAGVTCVTSPGCRWLTPRPCPSATSAGRPPLLRSGWRRPRRDVAGPRQDDRGPVHGAVV